MKVNIGKRLREDLYITINEMVNFEKAQDNITDQ